MDTLNIKTQMVLLYFRYPPHPTLEEGEYTLESKTDDGLEAKLDLFVPAGGIQPVNLILPKRIMEKRVQARQKNLTGKRLNTNR